MSIGRRGFCKVILGLSAMPAVLKAAGVGPNKEIKPKEDDGFDEGHELAGKSCCVWRKDGVQPVKIISIKEGDCDCGYAKMRYLILRGDGAGRKFSASYNQRQRIDWFDNERGAIRKYEEMRKA